MMKGDRKQGSLMFEKLTALLGLKPSIDPNFVKRRVLIVDDNEIDRQLIQRTVEKMGHDVLTAPNGKDGFDLAKSARPDLILSDCRMPEMDGVEMCKQLKTDPETKNIPLVFLTSVDTPKTVVECFDIGVENYMCKPINPKLLTSQVRTIFDECFAS